MSDTAGDVIVQTLLDWGVTHVFGIPGDGINGVMEALRLHREKIVFVQTRHEEAAAFAAVAYAKFTGRLGVCLSTSGPGGIHLLNGIYDAKLDHQPVLAITGLQYQDLLGTGTQQDVELDKLFMDACAYSTRIMSPAHAQNVTELAIRTALARRQPTHVTIASDTQSMTVSSSPRSPRNLAGHVSNVMSAPAMLPADDVLDAAARVLDAGRKVCILVGQGALHAGVEVAAVAERLAAPVVHALLGQGVLPDAHPHAMGGVGLLGTAPAQAAMDDCDTLLIVGSTFPYIEFYPKPGQARVVQIDRDAARIGLRAPVEVGLVGDSRKVLEALGSRLADRTDRAFLATAQDGRAQWDKQLATQGTDHAMPMKPQVVGWELDRAMPDDALVCGDSGTNTSWCARFVRMRGTRRVTWSGTLASMASGLPYAIGAAHAYPGRTVVAFVGDGGFTMLIGDLATIKKYHLNVKVVVISNDSLGQIKWEQMAFLGNPEYACELEPVDFAAVARGFGIAGYTITDPAACAATLATAFAAPGPAVIDCKVDTDEIPLPPRMSAKYARNFAQALARGTPHAGRIALTAAREMMRSVTG